MAKRRDSWTIENNDYETEEQFRAAVADELARFEHIGYRQGFGVVAAPVRQRLDNGSIVTLGWEFQTERIPLIGGAPQQPGPMPAAPPPEPEPEDDVVPVDAGPVDEDDPEPAPEPEVIETDPYAEATP